MTYHLKPSKKKDYRKVGVLSSLAVIVLALLFFVPSFFPNLLGFIGRPFISSTSYFGNITAGIGTTFTSKQDLEAQNQELKQKNQELNLQLDQTNLLQQENTELKKMMGRTLTKDTVLANILSRPPFTAYDSLLLDVGENNNIKVGDLVIAGGSVPIGSITNVYSTYSKANLFSSSGERVSIVIGKGIQTTAEAQGGGNFLVNLPKNTEVAVGDPIVIPALSNSLFGTVTSVEQNDNDPFKYIRFESPVNIFELRFVEVERNATL